MQINLRRLWLDVLFVAAAYWLFRSLRKEGTSYPAQIDANLDPHLQDVRLRQKEAKGQRRHLRYSSQSATVDVIAQLKNTDVEVLGLRVSSSAGDVVAGEVLVEDIVTVRRHPNVLSMKCARPLRTQLSHSVADIAATSGQLAPLLPPGIAALDGRGVIVGIIDDGCDFQHNNFRDHDGSSRILFLWDQSLPPSSESPHPYSYGREFSQARLNVALGVPDPYGFTGHRPPTGSHGTHVMLG